jgi:hypothetical protein
MFATPSLQQQHVETCLQLALMGQEDVGYKHCHIQGSYYTAACQHAASLGAVQQLCGERHLCLLHCLPAKQHVISQHGCTPAFQYISVFRGNLLHLAS